MALNDLRLSIVLTRAIRYYGLAISAFVLGGFSLICTMALYSAHTGLCHLVKAKIESVAEPISREMMLGNPEQASEIFDHLVRELDNSVVKNDLLLALTSVNNHADKFCSPSIFYSYVQSSLTFGDHSYGTIVGRVSYLSLPHGLVVFALLLVMIACTIQFFTYSILKYVRVKILYPITRLSLGHQFTNEEINASSTEVLAIHDNIQNLKFEIKSSEGERMRARGENRLSQLAVQVAHDIRSPLTTLKIALGSSLSLSKSERPLVENAIIRIEGIANELLQRNRQSTGTARTQVQVDSDKESLKKINPVQILNSIVAEKRIEFSRLPSIKINLEISEGLSGTTILGSEVRLASIVSNLINNAVEAIADVGCVDVSSERINDDLRICVADNGKGVEPEDLNELTRQGFTSGKDNGNGIGLHYARKSVEEWSGKLLILSRIGQGTKVVLVFPIQGTSSSLPLQQPD